jgi:hypothetical protein
MALIDVVNFNADASCLSSAKWLRCIEGGRDSLLVRALSAFVRTGRKVNVGFTGATAADIAHFNPEAIALINAHPEVFEIVARPFAHDNALLRLPAGFRYNVESGLATLRHHFVRVGDFYLAPEIMITGEQIHILHELGIRGVFVHKGRYDVSVARHIPDQPFTVHGTFSTPMRCVPFADKTLESSYLRALHGTTSARDWATEARRASERYCAIWRDGESSLLHPLEPQHEAAMLDEERAAGVDRAFLSELGDANATAPDGTLRYFPLHSMKPWLEAMKLFWYVDRVRHIEQSLDRLDERVKRFWLLTINSDILSAAEKSSPVVDVSDEVLRAGRDDFLWEGVIVVPEKKQLILTRSERAGEGEDYLAYLELLVAGRATPEEICARWSSAEEPHLKKALVRVCN